APSSPRPMSARSCAGPCATSRNQPRPRPREVRGMETASVAVGPDDVLAFWRAAGPAKWFTKDAAFDAEIRARFLPSYEAAAARRLGAWEATPEGACALVIVLDQFARNMFRDSVRTFAADPVAREVTGRALARGFDLQVPAI